MGNYRELIAWQKAMKLASAVYRATDSFPRREMYGLSAQIRRAAVSIPSNIAEGQGRRTDLEFVHFLGNARGSLVEVETQIEIARDLGFLTQTQPACFETKLRKWARHLRFDGLTAEASPRKGFS